MSKGIVYLLNALFCPKKSVNRFLNQHDTASAEQDRYFWNGGRYLDVQSNRDCKEEDIAIADASAEPLHAHHVVC